MDNIEPMRAFDQAAERLEKLDKTIGQLNPNEQAAKKLEFEEACDKLFHALNESLHPTKKMPSEVKLALEELKATKQNSDLAKMPQVLKAVEEFSEEVSKIQVYYTERLKKVNESEQGGSL